MDYHVTVKLLRGLLAACALLAAVPALGEPATVEVTEPYVELHTGPGPGYPATDAVRRGDRLTLLKRRTDWLRVRTPANREGWVHIDTLQASLAAAQGLEVKPREGWTARPTLGVAVGRFEDDPFVELSGSYPATPRVAVQVGLANIAGEYANARFYSVGVRYRFRPGKQLVPALSVSAGYFNGQPRATLVDAREETALALRLGAGVSYQFRPDLALTGELQHLRADFHDDIDDNTYSAAVLGLAYLF